MLNKLKLIYYKNKYQAGKHLSCFIDKDLKKEIIIINNEKLDKGILLVKERSFNKLHLSKGIIENIPEFSAPHEISIDSLWK